MHFGRAVNETFLTVRACVRGRVLGFKVRSTGVERSLYECLSQRPPSIDAKASKQVLARLLGGETVAALAREYSTCRQSIMRIRQACTHTNNENSLRK